MAKLLSFRVWLLIFVLFFAILAINPSPWSEGIEVQSVKEGSPLAEAGLQPGELVQRINKVDVASLGDFKDAVDALQFTPITVQIGTDKGAIEYTFTGDFGVVYENLTVVNVPQQRESEIEQGMIIQSVNGETVSDDESLTTVINALVNKQTFKLETNKGDYAVLVAQPPQIEVREAATSNIQKGLDLQGGTRVLLRPVAEEDQEVTSQQVTDLIDVLSNRLNVYGLADLKIQSASDLAGNKFVVVEIAGASRDEVKELIAQQGKFEAKIGDDVVFVGGKGDIPFVCRNDGSCSGIRPPCQDYGGQWSCTFQFTITLTEEAAERHAKITEVLPVNLSAGGEYLSKTLDFYLDEQQVDSLNIGADLKGRPTTQIAISGPGFGVNEQAAYEDAIVNMNKLQTVLITGSLPLKLEVERMDSISPVLGQEFIKNSFVVGFAAIIAVAGVIFIRYRKIKIVIPMVITTLSEVVIILGVAAFIRWNLDLAAIAGIIAAVGTGIDDQIVIMDEVVRGKQYLNWKEKVKRAFFIILTAYVTTVAAMIPLWNAGAGLIRGFAVTTIIGVTIGVLVTRPAFAAMMEKLLNK